jgi:hypothetical protein
MQEFIFDGETHGLWGENIAKMLVLKHYEIFCKDKKLKSLTLDCLARDLHRLIASLRSKQYPGGRGILPITYFRFPTFEQTRSEFENSIGWKIFSSPYEFTMHRTD